MKRLPLCIIYLGLLMPVIALGDAIYVSGNVSGVWSADTVFVTGEVTVLPADTLVIEPGVEVLFQVNCEFNVEFDACLIAVGTPTNPIRFDACIPGFRWQGINFVGPSDSSRLENCSITNSEDSGVDCYHSSPTIRYCRIDGCSAGEGGGIKCVLSSPTITNNIIEYNTASQGGAIYCHWNSNPVITNNTITGNMGGSYGGAIYCYNQSNPLIVDNVISDNMVTMGSGGAISCFYDSNPAISGNSFINNDASSFYGGAIFLENSNPEISDNSFYGNSARGGGGIHCYISSNPLIRRNLLIGNHTGDRDGGAICCNYASPTIINNTIVGNSAGDEGGVIYCISTANPIVVNNILWDNTPEQIGVYPDSHPEVTYCDILGGWEGIGNIDDDPLFVDPIMGDFYLQWGSPCIDAGDPNSPLDPDSTRADIGAYYYDQSTSVDHGYEPQRPLSYYLFPNYPNPFNASTMLSYALPERSVVELAVYNVAGQRVMTLVEGWQEAGSHKMTFDGSGLASGVYLCRLSVRTPTGQAGDFTAVNKMVLLK